jgi:hypothetical protein
MPIGDRKADELLRVLAGKVLHHGPDGDEAYLKARESPPGRYASNSCGAVPRERVLAPVCLVPFEGQADPSDGGAGWLRQTPQGVPW